MVYFKAQLTRKISSEFETLVQKISSPAYSADIAVEAFYFEPTSNFDPLDISLIEQLCADGIKIAKESSLPITKDALIVRGLFENSSYDTVIGKISYFFSVIADETSFFAEFGSRQHKERLDEFLALLDKHFKLTPELRYIEYFPFRASFASFGVAWGLWAIIIDTTRNRGLVLYLNAFL